LRQHRERPSGEDARFQISRNGLDCLNASSLHNLKRRLAGQLVVFLREEPKYRPRIATEDLEE
jgi:hypothetical protein